MTEFRHVEHATFSPTECVLCGNHEGPFIDTGVARDPIGHFWICASSPRRIGCVRQMGRLDGLFEPTSVEDIEQRLSKAVELMEPVVAKHLEAKLQAAYVLADQLTALVTELAKSKLVPALEVYEMGARASAREMEPEPVE